MELLKNWFHRTFNDPQVAAFTLVALVVVAGILLFGDALAPVIAAVVIAYLLEGLVRGLERRKVPRMLAVAGVFILFAVFLISVLFLLVPVLYRQTLQLADELPAILMQGQAVLLQLPEQYPQFFSEQQVRELLNTVRREVIDWFQRVAATFTLQSVVVLITLSIYVILVPFLVFFFLKDKERILRWISERMPRHRALASEIWTEIEAQIGNYVRGKFIEILIVAAVTYVTFRLLGLDFALLLAVATGLSVIIPYIGAFVMTLPVALIAYFQFGLSAEFAYVLIAYTVIQILDGNVLVPILFSEVVNLHPVAIIVAILVFGSIWGFWGIFFAIPLATVIQAVINGWMRRSKDNGEAAPEEEEEPAA